MAPKWKTYTLSDVCLKITDGAHQSPKSMDIGMPMCSVKDLTEFGLTLDTARQISEVDYQKLVRQGCMPLVGDVLIAKDGNSALDTTCSIDTEVETVLLSSVAILRPNPELLDSDYLKYWFKSKRTIDYLKSNFISGAAIPRVVLKDFKKAEIILPPLGRQRLISRVLRALDNKTQLNHQINQTLEQIAQAIFKSWFVDFEPVKAKIAALEAGGNEDDALLAAMQAISGKTPEDLTHLQAEQPKQYAELRATAELFPSAMRGSELGEIPEGWETTRSGDVIDVRDGTHDSPKKSSCGHPLVTSRHITSGTLKLDDAYLISKPDFEKVNQRSKVDHGDVLLTMIGTAGIPYLVSLRNVNFAIKNIGLFKTSKVTELSGFFYLLLKSDGMKAYLEARIAGTTQKYLSLTTLRGIEFVLPPSPVLTRFTKMTSSFFRATQENTEQTETLSSLRDTLLPKLLSGELSIMNTEPQLAEVEESANV